MAHKQGREKSSEACNYVDVSDSDDSEITSDEFNLAYYDDDVDVIDDSRAQASENSFTLEGTYYRSLQQPLSMASTVRDNSVDMLEENNNDPNNNVASTEAIDSENSESSIVQISHPGDSRMYAARDNDPRPGCSKDFLPVIDLTGTASDKFSLKHKSAAAPVVSNPLDAWTSGSTIKARRMTEAEEKKILHHFHSASCSDKVQTAKSVYRIMSGTNNDALMGTWRERNETIAFTHNVKRRLNNGERSTENEKTPFTWDIANESKRVKFVHPNGKGSLLVLKLVKPTTEPRHQDPQSSKAHKQNPEPALPLGSKQFHDSKAPKQFGNPIIIDDTLAATSKPVVGTLKKSNSRDEGSSANPVLVRNGTGFVPNISTNVQKNGTSQQNEGFIENVKIEPKINSGGRLSQIAQAKTTMAATTDQGQFAQHQQSTTRVHCAEMYNKLRMMFPTIDPEYIKRLCPPDWDTGDRNQQLTPIIDYLLQNADSLPTAPLNQQLTNEAASNDVDGIFTSVEGIYDTLLDIFPNADPHYLREFAEKNVSNAGAVREFIESQTEKPDYPTRQQHIARMKKTEQQKQYTSGFNTKHYLTVIPDPFTHFTNPNRICKWGTVGFEFLKGFFNKNTLVSINATYQKCRYNLSLTAQALEAIGPTMTSKRRSAEMPTEDIPLLQEIAFIKHKKDIQAHIVEVKKAEAEELQFMKAQNLLVECQVCFNPECVPSKCISCINGHVFCDGCVRTGTSTKMSDGESRVYCFANCGVEFRLIDLQNVLAPTKFSILLRNRQAAEIMEAGLEGLASCPFCHFATIPPEGEKIFKCLNSECMKESCLSCKELSHVPFKCAEVTNAEKARHYIEERMTQALARRCYKCNRAYFKEEGCNKITCPCGASMCYLCDKAISPGYAHFAGHGSQNPGLCPLNSDTVRLNAIAVRQVAEEAEKEVRQFDPNVKVDMVNLLPTLPQGLQSVMHLQDLRRRPQQVPKFDWNV